MIESYKNKFNTAIKEKDAAFAKLGDLENTLRICKTELECKKNMLLALQNKNDGKDNLQNTSVNYEQEVLEWKERCRVKDKDLQRKDTMLNNLKGMNSELRLQKDELDVASRTAQQAASR